MPGLSTLSTARSIPLAAFILAAASTLPGMAVLAEAAGNPFEKLSGDWTGEGTVRTKDGPLKTVSCKANYKTTGSNLSQTLNCTGEDYEINAKLKLTDKDGKVKGNWTETVYDASGGVTGKAHENIIHAVISGDKFSGRLSLKVTDDGLSITMLELNESSGTYRLATSLRLHR